MSPRPCPLLLFASQNPSKLLTYEPIFKSMGFEITDLNRVQSSSIKPVEDAPTVTGNAVIKARFYQSKEFPNVFAEDIGICFDALNDEPGVQARRWGGLFSDDVDDQTWMDYLLMRMQNVPNPQRTGRFITGWALACAQDSTVHTHQLQIPFRIHQSPIRPMTPGSPMTALIAGP